MNELLDTLNALIDVADRMDTIAADSEGVASKIPMTDARQIIKMAILNTCKEILQNTRFGENV